MPNGASIPIEQGEDLLEAAQIGQQAVAAVQRKAADQRDNRLEQEIARKRIRLSEAEELRDQASQNMARAKNDAPCEAIAAVFDRLTQQANSIQEEMPSTESELNKANEADSAIEVALETS